jgi:hypothetical protein
MDEQQKGVPARGVAGELSVARPYLQGVPATGVTGPGTGVTGPGNGIAGPGATPPVAPDTTAVTPASAMTRESVAEPLPLATSTHEPPTLFRVESSSGGAFGFDAARRTTIVVAVVRNRAEIDLLAASFLELIDVKLGALRQERSNSDEAAAEIADYEDLKRRIEAFLDRASRFVEKKTDESSVVIATTLFAQGLSAWWSKRHVEICDQAYGKLLTGLDMAIFGIGVDICVQAGATGALVIAIPGVIAGGDRVLQAVKAVLGSKKGKAD